MRVSTLRSRSLGDCNLVVSFLRWRGINRDLLLHLRLLRLLNADCLNPLEHFDLVSKRDFHFDKALAVEFHERFEIIEPALYQYVGVLRQIDGCEEVADLLVGECLLRDQGLLEVGGSEG